jgi:hypothetical protein
VEAANTDALRRKLAELEAIEAQLSRERHFLHNKIDFGFATATTRAREREVSDKRRELHRRIDALREQLRELELVQPHPTA